MATFHMPKGYGFFISGNSLITYGALVILFTLIAWAVGGTGFKDDIFGNWALALGALGVVTGLGLTLWGQTHGHHQR